MTDASPRHEWQLNQNVSASSTASSSDALPPDCHHMMASQRPAKGSKTSRRRLQGIPLPRLRLRCPDKWLGVEIALTPNTSAYPIEVKVLVDGQEVHRLPRIEKKNILRWKDLILPWQENISPGASLRAKITGLQ
ncbi:hypothetical protein FRC08_007510 [Ceratobasidium sp. 394]|nr:hypothetical protein FRC08_007510 [Ceratobasidium sp. 394]